jgi:hypothetical protein
VETLRSNPRLWWDDAVIGSNPDALYWPHMYKWISGCANCYELPNLRLT